MLSQPWSEICGFALPNGPSVKTFELPESDHEIRSDAIDGLITSRTATVNTPRLSAAATQSVAILPTYLISTTGCLPQKSPTSASALLWAGPESSVHQKVSKNRRFALGLHSPSFLISNRNVSSVASVFRPHHFASKTHLTLAPRSSSKTARSARLFVPGYTADSHFTRTCGIHALKISQTICGS